MKFDYIVIGSGPAGSILSSELSNSGFKVAMVDRATNNKKSKINDFFCPYIKTCPKYYTPVYSNILGGNSELWHSKIYLLSEKEITKYKWNIKYKELLKFSKKLAKKLNVEEKLLIKSENFKNSGSYVYSLRAKFRNIYKFLKIDENKNITVFKGYSPTKIFIKKRRAEKIVISDGIFEKKTISLSRAIIFCAGGLGNPHLLLNLINKKNKLLGKFLSDHPHVNLGKIKSSRFEDFKKIAKPNILNNLNINQNEIAFVRSNKQIFSGIQLDYKTDPLRKLRRTFIRIKNISLRRFLSIFGFFITKLNGLYHKLGIIFGKYYKYSFEFFFSQTPHVRNNVYLSESVDEFGLKKINVNWNINQKDLLKYNKLIKQNFLEINQSIKGHKSLNFEENFYKNGLSGLHPSCTTKIGTNSKKGVVDSNLKLFDHKNIYVCGSSVFPFNGYTNPTWTIMSLALRLADILKDKFK